MRSFAETLPLLPAPVADAEETASEPTRFDPEALLEALSARKRLEDSKGPDFGTRAPAPRQRANTPATDAFRRVDLDEADRPVRRGTDPKLAAIAAIPALDTKVSIQSVDDADAADAARAEAEAAREAAVEAAREEERSEAEARLEAERAKWSEETAKDLAAQLDAGLEALHDRLAEALAAALAPVLEEAVIKRAVTSFASRLETLTTGRATSGLTIKGPQHLIDALKEEWGERRVRLITEIADQPELSVDIAETTLRTSVRLWAAAISNGSRHEPK